MPGSMRTPRPEGGPPDSVSARFTMNGHPYRLYRFRGEPDREPPPQTVAIPDEDGSGVTWLVPERVRLMRADSSF